MNSEQALRFQRSFGIPTDYLIRLQASHDFKKAYRSKNSAIGEEVVV